MSEKPPSPSRVAAARLKRITARKLKRSLDPDVERLADRKLARAKRGTGTPPLAPGRVTVDVPGGGPPATSSGNWADRRVAERRSGDRRDATFGQGQAQGPGSPKPSEARIRYLEREVAQRLADRFPQSGISDVDLFSYSDATPGLWYWRISVTAVSPGLLDEYAVKEAVTDLLGRNPNDIVRIHQSD